MVHRLMARPARLLSVEKRPNLTFWLTQLTILISTVLGVYLASVAGFQIAVNFDRYQAAGDVLNIEQALRAEVSDNTDKVDAWVEAYKKAPMTWHDKNAAPRERHRLDLTIWQTMRYAPRTFEVKGDILTEVRRYYGKLDLAMEILFQQRQPNGYAKAAMKDLAEATAHAKAIVLPTIDAQIKIQEKRLKDLLE